MRAPIVCLMLVLLAPAGGRASELLPPGAAFPPWSLVDQTGTAVRSSDLAGRSYLLWFYPKAMTPGCTAEGIALRDRAAEFEAAGVTILGVSFDPPAANAEFARAHRFPFRLLSDSGRTLAVAVGAAATTGQAAPRRVSYLIGPDGRVRHAYATVDPATHAQQVLDDLRRERAQ